MGKSFFFRILISDSKNTELKINKVYESIQDNGYQHIITVLQISNFEMEIEHHLMNAYWCYYSLNKILSSKLLSRATKLNCNKTIIECLLLYAVEALVLTKKQENCS